MSWTIEDSPLGRVAIPGGLPDNLALCCTSSDFSGLLDGGSVERLRRFMATRFGVDGPLASCGQVHGATVVAAGSADGSWCEHEGCDALVGDQPGSLIIKIADCLPVALSNSVTGRRANAHSGWRGAASGVVPATLAALCPPSERSSVRAWLGPSIRVCCFEVGEEVVEALRLAYGNIDDFVVRSNSEKPHVDLAGLTMRILTGEGVPLPSIDDSGLCTRCEGSIFHSYRRDGTNAGRNLMLIGCQAERVACIR